MERIKDKKVTVRKSRICFGCLRKINKGETANIQTNSEDGKIYSLTLCTECQEKTTEMHYNDEFFEGDFAHA